MISLNSKQDSDVLGIARSSLCYAALAVCLYDVALLAFLPVFYISLLLGMVFAKVVSAYRLFFRLSKTWLMVLAIVGMVLIAWSYQFRLTRNSTACLFLWVIHLKLYELETVRDLRFFALFSLMIGFVLVLFAQSLWFAALLIVSLWLVIVALLQADNHSSTAVMSSTIPARALQWLTFALPIAFILFVLFPRPPSSKMTLPEDTLSEMQGVSNEMRIDSIQSLSKSNAIAFRVKLNPPIKNKQDLYWRGPVMSYFNGRHWRTTRKLQPLVDWNVPAESQWIQQEVLIEPTNQDWLYALDTPVQIEAEEAFITRERTIHRMLPLQRPLKYRVWSAKPRKSVSEIPQHILHRYLQLPIDIAPKTLALATAWGDETNHDPRLVLAKAKSFFHHGFQYTQNPPRLRSDMVDDFVFRTKTGFCEHFSSAFVVMMRAAGVPARVVVGYQGGEYNQISGYYILRHTDAHAWSEIWINKEGWVRVDPTQWAKILPDNETDSEQTTNKQRNDKTPKAIEQLRSLSPVFEWKQLRQFKDYLEQEWQERVIEYNHREQRHTLIAASEWITSSKRVLLTMLMFVFLTIFIVACYLQYSPYWRRSEEERLWLRFSRLFERRGVVQQTYEGPLDFSKRCIATQPEARDSIEAFLQAYLQIKFGHHGSVNTLRLSFNHLQYRLKEVQRNSR